MNSNENKTTAEFNPPGEKGLQTITLAKLDGISTKTAICQCCGNEGIRAICLFKIDSGQLLCPDCLKSLRNAAYRITV